MENRNMNGLRGSWAVPYQGDRPRDILNLTEAQEALLDVMAGWKGRDQAGNQSQLFLLTYLGTTAPTLTDFANTPVGTMLICPNVTGGPKMYMHAAQSSPGVVGDWYEFTLTQVT